MMSTYVIGHRFFDQIVNTYGGTLFIGYCDAADLVKHFDEITKKLENGWAKAE